MYVAHRSNCQIPLLLRHMSTCALNSKLHTPGRGRCSSDRPGRSPPRPRRPPCNARAAAVRVGWGYASRYPCALLRALTAVAAARVDMGRAHCRACLRPHSCCCACRSGRSGTFSLPPFAAHSPPLPLHASKGLLWHVFVDELLWATTDILEADLYTIAYGSEELAGGQPWKESDAPTVPTRCVDRDTRPRPTRLGALPPKTQHNATSSPTP